MVLPGRYTTSNLVSYVSDIAEGLDKQKEVHAIYTDFRKAFDVVKHNILLNKIEHIGINGSLLRWIESYLNNPSQLVNIRGFKSEQCKVISGVPQGSHLGPLLFLIFINNLFNDIKSNFNFFADDLKIHPIINQESDKYI